MKDCSPPTVCQISGVRCQVSGVRCQLIFFVGQNVGASWRRVCYQWGLPYLVVYPFRLGFLKATSLFIIVFIFLNTHPMIGLTLRYWNLTMSLKCLCPHFSNYNFRVICSRFLWNLEPFNFISKLHIQFNIEEKVSKLLLD